MYSLRVMPLPKIMPSAKVPALKPLALVFALSPAATLAAPTASDWQELFNGKDLNNWAIKVRHSKLGENTHDTFRAEDGLLKVRYDQYPDFNDDFGHIFYKERPFSYYRLQVEYRFTGAQVDGGPEWAWRNNGIMYHAQAPETMALGQDFPLSIEYQLLGGKESGERSTANLCTPGTHVVMAPVLRKDHCINSTSTTFAGDQWVTVELEVHGRELAVHKVNGIEVMRYTDLQKDDGTALSSGYIALQAESSPIDFRSVKLLNLEGCMDKDASNYKDYLIKHDAGACQY
ncbi:3-keto-disaccharide hydrolase [Gilvimarinus chinensis]|uniref:3-keto-disaccharide hydrolase n=1 Tax=Gilvimarinus chinensis TaxID=396005 RepID=UPI0003600D31|nr:DUF1080 domain-containing protein [Gilvimarinus chinensis]